MANRIDNLGDYNIVREDLKSHNGDVDSLYKSIGDAAIAEVRDSIWKDGAKTGFFGGILASCVIVFSAWGITKIVKYSKQREEDKKLIDSADELKERFDSVVSCVEDNSDIEE